MDDTTCSCRSQQGPLSGHMAPGARWQRHDWQRQGRRFRCERSGGIMTDATTVLKRLCRQAGKPYLPLRSASLTSFIAALRRFERPALR